MRFEIDIVERAGAVYVAIEGELDVATAALLGERIAEAEARPAALVVIDLAQVEFMDSTALAVLLAADARSRADGRRLRLTAPTPQVRRLLEVAGVLDRLPFVDPADPR